MKKRAHDLTDRLAARNDFDILLALQIMALHIVYNLQPALLIEVQLTAGCADRNGAPGGTTRGGCIYDMAYSLAHLD